MAARAGPAEFAHTYPARHRTNYWAWRRLVKLQGKESVRQRSSRRCSKLSAMLVSAIFPHGWFRATKFGNAVAHPGAGLLPKSPGGGPCTRFGR